jgi:hypothetical protein
MKNSVSFGGNNYDVVHICDIIHSNGAEVLGTYGSDFYAGMPAVTKNAYGKGKAYYVAFRNDDSFAKDFCTSLISEIGIERDCGIEAHPGVMIRKRGNTIFVMNFSSTDAGVVFDKEYKKADMQYYRDEYIKTFKTERANPNEDNSPTVIEQKLQWLEHRRWNAFLRTMGFCGTDNYNVYKAKTKSPKNMEMKLHPCLVECLIPVCGKCNKERCLDCEEVYRAIEKDLLDELSVEFDSDYKGYDFSGCQDRQLRCG